MEWINGEKLLVNNGCRGLLNLLIGVKLKMRLIIKYIFVILKIINLVLCWKVWIVI